MNKFANVFTWDYKDEAPFIEMLMFSRKHPELHLFEIHNHGIQLYVYIFALNAATAKRQASEISEVIRLQTTNSIANEYPAKRFKTKKYF